MHTELDAVQLKRRRAVIKSSCTRIKSYVDSIASITPAVAAQLEERKLKLDQFWIDYNDIQSQLEMHDESEASDRVAFEEAFFSLSAKFREILTPPIISRGAAVTSPSLSRVSESPDSLLHVRLPRLNLPTFSGKYDEWFPFHDSFHSIIHSNPSISNVQKLQYLRASLVGDASNIINSLEISDANYSVAWDLLRERYDNKRAIVQTHIKAIVDLPTMVREGSRELRQIADGAARHVHALRALKCPTDSWDDLLVFILSSKLDVVTAREWQSSLTGSELPTLKQFLDFATHRCRAFEATDKAIGAITKNVVSRSHINPKKQASCVATIKMKCIYCRADHSIYQCRQFLALSIPRRIEEARAHKLCLNCLRSTTHSSNNCPSGKCRTCGHKHNTLLHLHTPSSEQPGHSVVDERDSQKTGSATTSETVVSCVTNSLNNNCVFLSTALALVKGKDGRLESCRVLLDSGSQANFISRDFSNSLGLASQPINVAISGINGTTTNSNHSVQLTLCSRINSFSTVINCIVTDNITQNIPAYTMKRSAFDLPRNLELADPRFYESSKIDILVGAELFWNLICVGQIKPSRSHPTLQKTRLGWILAGTLSSNSAQPREVQSFHTSISNIELHNQLNRFWRFDEFTCNSAEYSHEENACEKHFLETVSQDNQGRYIVQLPFKKHLIHDLGYSRDTALKRLASLQKRLNCNPNLKKLYSEFIDEYQALGHMKPVIEQSSDEPGTFYMPHHCIFKDTSQGVKLRVVFDGSCKTSSGLSLNDALMVGPVVQEDLMTILTRFRTFKYVLVADIVKMYRQILIHPSQTRLQRILWRNDNHSKLQTFELTTVTYGTSAASYLATRCLKHLAEERSDSLPIGALHVKRDFYVDDLLTGADSLLEAKNIRDQVVQLLQRGSFKLSKWGSNCPELLEDVNDKGDDPVVIDKESNSRILGVSWNHSNDTFQFSYHHHDSPDVVTKRSILSDLSRLFDPLGLLGPVIVVAKIILQELWQSQIDWDQSIPQDAFTRWSQLKSQLPRLNQLQISRCVKNYADSKFVQLHGFCDASQRAFGACAYIRTKTDNGGYQCKLLCAKSRVAPVRAISLPRLELSAAVLLSRLIEKIGSSIDLTNVEIFLWTDSTITLNWITSLSRKWSTFVANRVGEIQRLTDLSSWRHIPSSENPADALSRGLLPNHLLNSHCWWNGPEFLQSINDQWPSGEFNQLTEDMPEQVRAYASTATPTFNIIDELLTRFSDLNKICRILAYCLRFSSSRNSKSTTVLITPTETSNALNIMCKAVQRQVFSNDYSLLKEHGEINSSSSLLSLSPFINEDGLIRVGGRLQNSALPYDARHQIILPRNHTLTKLLIEFEHKRNMHSGLQATMAFVRQRFWPLSLRSLVRKIIRNCVTCFKAKPIFSVGLMGSLPTSRVTPSRPFSRCGIDYAGPVILREGKRRNSRNNKAYIAIFVCFATKAVHIELVSDLTTDAFIAALKRLIARRGRPDEMYSDNATTFVGAQKLIKEFYDFLKSDHAQLAIGEFLRDQQTTWNFIPPSAPHFGGLWEAAVKSAKSHLTRVVSRAHLTFEEMLTVLCEIEAILNSRPLVPLSSDPNDMTYLSPGHFLVGTPLNSFPQPELVDENTTVLLRWQMIEQMRQHFWRRWSSEYLHHLQERHKWKTCKGQQLMTGQLVMIKQSSLAPMQWLVGRVEQVHLGSDGVARSATVKTAKNSYVRPLSKLAILPLESASHVSSSQCL